MERSPSILLKKTLTEELTRELDTDVGMIQVVMGSQKVPGHALALGQTVERARGTTHDLEETILALYIVPGMKGIGVVALQTGWTSPEGRLVDLSILIGVSRCGCGQLFPEPDTISVRYLTTGTTGSLGQAEGHLRTTAENGHLAAVGATHILPGIVGIQMKAIGAARTSGEDHGWEFRVL